MKNVYFLFIYACVFASLTAKAQISDLSLLDLNYHYNNLKNDSTNGKLNNFNVAVTLPVFKNDKNFVGGRLLYKMRNINEVNNDINRNLHSFDVNMFWRRKLNEKSGLLAFAQLGVYSEFKDWDKRDLQYALGFRYNFQLGEKLKTGLGLIYNRQFFGNQINPFIYIDYSFGNRWRIEGLIPIQPKLIFKINDKMNWMTEYNLSVSSFRLTSNTASNSFIRINNKNIISRIEYTIKNHHRFYIGIGQNIRQDLKLYSGTSQNDWTIFNRDITEKEKPVYQSQTSGYRIEIGYKFVVANNTNKSE